MSSARLETADTRAGVAALAAGFSIEAIPSAVTSGGETLALPAGTQVYVPAIPGTDFAEAVAACRLLSQAGLTAVPHLSARAVRGRDDLRGRLEAFRGAGARALLLIAGDVKNQAGPYASTLDILETGLLAEFGFDRIGVAGHPEGLPPAAPGEAARALAVKAAYARETGCEMWIVTQFAFAAEPITAWMRALRASGIDLPVRVGVAGPAGLRKLIAYAVRCGVGNSIRVLTDRPISAGKLLGRWSPDSLLADLARHNAHYPAEAIAAIHIYPFGGVGKAWGWVQSLGPPG